MFCRVHAQRCVVFDYIALRSYIRMPNLAINAPIENPVCFAVVSNTNLSAAATTNFAMLAVNRQFG